ncbi:MAG: hypothetical protein QF893_21460 [Alphaproteobacteria bacterium]|nr:hypothetical protein [Alphaproteobacteria bacterium]
MLVLATFFTAVSANAESALTSRQIQGFIGALPEFKALDAKYPRQPKRLVESPSAAGTSPNWAPFTSALPEMRAHPAHGEIVSIVKRNGFSGLGQFAGVADRIIKSYVSLKAGPQMRQVGPQVEQAIRQIEASGMPEAQKRQMIAAMRNSQQMSAAVQKVPAADLAAVRPHLASIDAVLQ